MYQLFIDEISSVSWHKLASLAEMMSHICFYCSIVFYTFIFYTQTRSCTFSFCPQRSFTELLHPGTLPGPPEMIGRPAGQGGVGQGAEPLTCPARIVWYQINLAPTPAALLRVIIESKRVVFRVSTGFVSKCLRQDSPACLDRGGRPPRPLVCEGLLLKAVAIFGEFLETEEPYLDKKGGAFDQSMHQSLYVNQTGTPPVFH